LTTAPTTAAPLESVTVPVTVAVTSCATILCAPLKTSAKLTNIQQTPRKLFFISCSSKEVATPRRPQRLFLQIRDERQTPKYRMGHSYIAETSRRQGKTAYLQN
jgi:hypothetical protein